MGGGKRGERGPKRPPSPIRVLRRFPSRDPLCKRAKRRIRDPRQRTERRKDEEERVRKQEAGEGKEEEVVEVSVIE